MIAALFVIRDGPYYDIPDIDPWDEERDARLYPGPYPVIAHPPCSRWGSYWGGGPLLAGTDKQKKLGDDGGCFAAAFQAVRKYGGVIEHPAKSRAWDFFGINRPPHTGGWVWAGFEGGWTCHVEQGHYGHPARKATWLYAVNTELPTLKWGPCGRKARMDDGYHNAMERRLAKQNGTHVRRNKLSAKERSETPIPFRDLLISIARTAS